MHLHLIYSRDGVRVLEQDLERLYAKIGDANGLYDTWQVKFRPGSSASKIR